MVEETEAAVIPARIQQALDVIFMPTAGLNWYFHCTPPLLGGYTPQVIVECGVSGQDQVMEVLLGLMALFVLGKDKIR